MNFYKNFVLTLLFTFSWMQVVFSQYFVRTYTQGERFESTFLSADMAHDTSLILQKSTFCALRKSCEIFQKFDNNYDVSSESVLDSLIGQSYTRKFRNDTIFYSGNSRDLLDSTRYWYFGMMTIDGVILNQYKYKMARMDEVRCLGSNCYFPDNYGLTLVNNDEVVLYGEGLLKEDTIVGKVNKSVFLRIGLDGKPRGDIVWFEINNNVDRKMNECITDNDGQLVFSYYYEPEEVSPDSLNDRKLAIIKLNDDNTFTALADIWCCQIPSFKPRITIDNDGAYYVSLSSKIKVFEEDYLTDPSEVRLLCKLNSNGEIVWQKEVPPLVRIPFFGVFSNRMSVDRIKLGESGDIFCTGQIFVIDSVFIDSLKGYYAFSDFTSYIARYTVEGELLWRHILIRPRETETLQKKLYHPWLNDVIEQSDGSILFVGGIRRRPDREILDALIMRLSPEGCLNRACDHVGKYWLWMDSIPSSIVHDVVSQNLIIHPNPAKDFVNFTLPDNFSFPIRYELVQIATGQRIEYGIYDASHPMRLETHYLKSGLYALRMVDAVGKLANGKVIIH